MLFTEALIASLTPISSPQHSASAVLDTIPAPGARLRDSFGRAITDVKGAKDADAVFGMAYAQAEDDFNRVETNYLTALGRTAEAEGEGAIWADLRQKLYVDPADLQAKYAASPAWLTGSMACNATLTCSTASPFRHDVEQVSEKVLQRIFRDPSSPDRAR